MSFQTCKTFVHRRKTNEDILMKSEWFLSLHWHSNYNIDASKSS